MLKIKSLVTLFMAVSSCLSFGSNLSVEKILITPEGKLQVGDTVRITVLFTATAEPEFVEINGTSALVKSMPSELEGLGNRFATIETSFQETGSYKVNLRALVGGENFTYDTEYNVVLVDKKDCTTARYKYASLRFFQLNSEDRWHKVCEFP